MQGKGTTLVGLREIYKNLPASTVHVPPAICYRLVLAATYRTINPQYVHKLRAS
jgi:hypothetical protein